MKPAIFCTLTVLLLFSFLPLKSQTFVFKQKANASDRAPDDHFGYSSDVSGDYMIVGAPLEDEDINGNNTLAVAGSAYIYERDIAGNWNQVQKLVPSQRAIGNRFGISVAISGDYAIVGAYNDRLDASGSNSLTNAGAAFVFERNGAGVWVEVQKIVASDRSGGELFGGAVDISGDYAIIGANRDGEDVNGMNSLTFAGSAYVFERNGLGVWNQVQKLTANQRSMIDFFGWTVAIDGDYAVVGCHLDEEDVNELNPLNNGGAAYIFNRSTAGIWNFYQKICPLDRTADDAFGSSVSISGPWIAVGTLYQDTDSSGNNFVSGAGAAYLFRRNGTGVFTQRDKISASDRAVDDGFGDPVSISGDMLVAGSRRNDGDVSGGNLLNNAGAAYIFTRNGGNWSEIQKITSSDRSADDFFGYSVSIDQDYVVVSTHTDDQDELGINSLSNAGSAYIYEPRGVVLNVEESGLTAVENWQNRQVELFYDAREEGLFELWRGQKENDLTFWQATEGQEGEKLAWIDQQPFTGWTYYQVRYHGQNGVLVKSNLVQIDHQLTFLPKLYPNPSKGVAFFDLTGQESVFHVECYGLSGKEIKSLQIEGGQIARFDWGDLPAGFYTLKVSWEEGGVFQTYRTSLVRQ